MLYEVITIAVILIIIEASTMGLTTIWFALGALISMVLAFLNLPIVWQILLFLVVSAILLIFTRPVAVKKLKIGSVKTNSDNIPGQRGRVTQDIKEDEKGLVKINGQIWSATEVNGKAVAKDTYVIIEKIEGVTLYVRAEE